MTGDVLYSWIEFSVRVRPGAVYHRRASIFRIADDQPTIPRPETPGQERIAKKMGVSDCRFLHEINSVLTGKKCHTLQAGRGF